MLICASLLIILYLCGPLISSISKDYDSLPGKSKTLFLFSISCEKRTLTVDPARLTFFDINWLQINMIKGTNIQKTIKIDGQAPVAKTNKQTVKQN